MKQFKRFILLVLCIGCFSSTLLVSAGSNSRTIYNSQKTVKAYSKASYSKATIKNHLKISAEINGGCDASKIGASNSAYYKYKPGGAVTQVNINFGMQILQMVNIKSRKSMQVQQFLST